ncbi:hypothetical protein GCM10017709_33790 [Glutamicibacter nicotianae]
MHPAGLPELLHAGIDQPEAGAPLLPEPHLFGGVRVLLRPGPVEVVELRTQIPLRKLRVMVVQVPAEVPPGQLAPHCGGSCCSFGIFGGKAA